jgi:hypothetical protein
MGDVIFLLHRPGIPRQYHHLCSRPHSLWRAETPICPLLRGLSDLPDQRELRMFSYSCLHNFPLVPPRILCPPILLRYPDQNSAWGSCGNTRTTACKRGSHSSRSPGSTSECSCGVPPCRLPVNVREGGDDRRPREAAHERCGRVREVMAAVVVQTSFTSPPPPSPVSHFLVGP